MGVGVIGKYVMQASKTNPVGLTDDDLREIDRTLLDYLREGRVTPAYARHRLLDETDREEISGAYISQRLKRFGEHGHVRNLYETGLYELVEDIE